MSIVEKNVVPDFIVRAMIRYLLSNRLKEEREVSACGCSRAILLAGHRCPKHTCDIPDFDPGCIFGCDTATILPECVATARQQCPFTCKSALQGKTVGELVEAKHAFVDELKTMPIAINTGARTSLA